MASQRGGITGDEHENEYFDDSDAPNIPNSPSEAECDLGRPTTADVVALLATETL
jgi:hypothetical protein